MRKVVSAVVAIVVAGVATACSSSKTTAPSASVSTAFHFDSVYNLALGQKNHGDSSRAAAISYIALALGAGATPKAVTIKTGGTAVAYQAAAVELVLLNSSLVPTDSEFLVTAWNNSNADQIVLSVQDVAHPSLSADLVLADTVVIAPDSGSAADTVVGTPSGRCTTTDVAAAEYILSMLHTSLTTAPCTVGKTKASFDWHFTSPPSASTPYVLSSQTFVTPRLLIPPS